MEEQLIIYKPLEADDTITKYGEICDVQDKTKGSKQCFKTIVKNSKGEIIAEQYGTNYVRGLGGYGDKGTFVMKVNKAPKRDPDAVFEYKTMAS